MEVDRPAQQWFAVDEAGRTHEFRDHMTFHDGAPSAPQTAKTDELVGPLALAFPESLLWWGGHSHGFWPVLIEKKGERSLLLTFELGRGIEKRRPSSFPELDVVYPDY